MSTLSSRARDGCDPFGAGRLQGRTVIARLARTVAISVIDAHDHLVIPFVEVDLCDRQGGLGTGMS